MVLKSNGFPFGSKYYIQITGAAMGKPTIPNYANLFINNLRSFIQIDRQ